MELIKLKLLDTDGMTLLTAPAAGQVSLVYMNAYKPGDRVSLEIGTPGQYVVIQFEDTMAPALVYVVKREINFHIPFGEQAITYSPKSFAGACHIIRARFATPEEIAARRNLAYNPYDEHGDTGFFPHAHANVETRGPQRHRRHLRERRPRHLALPELGHQPRPQRRTHAGLWPPGHHRRAAPDPARRLPA